MLIGWYNAGSLMLLWIDHRLAGCCRQVEKKIYNESKTQRFRRSIGGESKGKQKGKRVLQEAEVAKMT